MIIKDNLEFHAAELRKMPGFDGWLPARIPDAVAASLNSRAQFIAADTVTAEIRFVTDAKNIRLTLSAIKPEFGLDQLEVRIFFGNFLYQTHWLKPGEISTVMFSPPPVLPRIKDEYLRKGPGIGFAPNVCRVVSQRGSLIYCGIETFGHDVRPPEASEKPAKTCLFYGSSITNSTLDGFPSVVGQRLGVDIINLGLSGACHVEPELADWMAALDGWDLAVFELGINVLTVLTCDEFRSRVDHLLEVFTARHPEKPLVLLTIFPSWYRPAFQKDPGDENRDTVFCDILRELYGKYRTKGNLHLVEGSDILNDCCALGADWVHPKNYGHALMGLNLAEKLKALL